jgi:hypothetical protein
MDVAAASGFLVDVLVEALVVLALAYRRKVSLGSGDAMLRPSSTYWYFSVSIQNDDVRRKIIILWRVFSCGGARWC